MNKKLCGRLARQARDIILILAPKQHSLFEWAHWMVSAALNRSIQHFQLISIQTFTEEEDEDQDQCDQKKIAKCLGIKVAQKWFH